MPTVSLKKLELFEALRRSYTQEEFDELCFEFGIELDDVVLENGEEIYKIDLPANRYDLLCLEGLSRALLIFQGKLKAPQYLPITPDEKTLKSTMMRVKKETSSIRPFVVCAVLRNVHFTQSNYESFIALQDQLHRNICRRRTLVAIGTHDLDSVKGPFTYEALKPEDIKFKHLFANKEMNGKEMLDWFRNDPEGKHIKEYTGIIYDSPLYPVIFDSNREVLSLPPIINGAKSKISLETKNVFIECTATDFTKANVVLNTVVAMFSEYCSKQFSVEKVKVSYEEKPVQIKMFSSHVDDMYPDVSVRKATAELKEVIEIVGVNLSHEEVVSLCDRMQLGPARVFTDAIGPKIEVTVPITRSDILHACDIVEDVAIAYGYNNIQHRVPVSHGPGGELKINFLSDAIRNDLARFGFAELMSFALCSHDENFSNLNKIDSRTEAVVLANPKTIEFQVVRTSLIPGALKTLAENKSLKFSDGIKLFEVSDVVKLCNEDNFLKSEIKQDEKDIGCKNERHIVCLYAGPTAGVEIIHGTLDRLMQSMAVLPAKEYCPEAFEDAYVQNLLKNDAHWGFYTLESKHESVDETKPGTFFPGMSAKILVKKKNSGIFRQVGEFGALHPTVLENFKLSIPAAVLELNLEPFV